MLQVTANYALLENSVLDKVKNILQETVVLAITVLVDKMLLLHIISGRGSTDQTDTVYVCVHIVNEDICTQRSNEICSHN